MNNCKKYIEQMNMYLDGELKASEIPQLLEHIEKCPNCEKRFEMLKLITFGMREADIAVPENLHEKIMAGVKEEQKLHRNKKRIARISKFSALAAVLVIAMMGAYIKFMPLSKSTESAGNAENTMQDTVLAETKGAPKTAVFASGQNSVENAAEDVAKGGKAIADIKTFAFYKIYEGDEPLPDFVTDEYEYTYSEGNGLYYVYVQNTDDTVKTFESELESCGYTESDTDADFAEADPQSEYGIYIIAAR